MTTLSVTPREKIRLLMDALSLDGAKFARRVGVSSATMSRILDMDSEKPISDIILNRIATSLEIPMSWLTNGIETQLPTIKTAPILSADGDGIRLKLFFKRNGFTAKQLAQEMQVEPPTISYYTQAKQLTPEVRTRVLAALGRLLERPVSEIEVFSKGLNPVVPVSADSHSMVRLPRLSAANRRGIDAEKLNLIRYSATSNLATTWLIDSRTVAGMPVTDLFALEIAPGDRIDPKLNAGDWVLVQQIEPERFSAVRDGLVAVLTHHNEFFVRQVQRNELSTGGPLTLTSYTEGSGAIITLQQNEIAAMLKLIRGVDVAL